MVLGVELLSESRTKLCNTLRKVMSWIHAKGSAAERIVQEAEAVDQWKVTEFSSIMVPPHPFHYISLLTLGSASTIKGTD